MTGLITVMSLWKSCEDGCVVAWQLAVVATYRKWCSCSRVAVVMMVLLLFLVLVTVLVRLWLQLLTVVDC